MPTKKVPIRIVIKRDIDENVTRFHTTFPLSDLERGEIKSDLRSVPGIAEGESSVQPLRRYGVYVCKLTAFRWEEIDPEVVRILGKASGSKEVEVEENGHTEKIVLD